MTRTSTDTLKPSHVKALRSEAALAGDQDMVRICDSALTGHYAAILACVDVINADAANHEDDDQ